MNVSLWVSVKVRTLRAIYGPGCSPDDELADVLETMDEPSLSWLVHDDERGQLEDKIASVA